MSVWSRRPPEIANLFNPAFCGILLIRAVGGYTTETAGAGMPFSLAFLPLPIVLHEPTRTVLPKSKATSMIIWLQRQPEVRVGFPSRVRGLTGPTREALLFAATRGFLAIGEDGRIRVGKRPYDSSRLEANSPDYKQCAVKAGLVGRMLARAGRPTTVFALWGIRP